MNLDHLYYFNAVVECGNINNAAKKLFISQPALTNSIKKLEEELNVPLFDRSSNRLVLNRSGRALYEITSKITALADSIPACLSEVSDIPPKNIVFISSYQHMLHLFYEKILDTLVEIDFEGILEFEPSYDWLVSGKADLILGSMQETSPDIPQMLDKGIERLFLYKESLFVAAPPGHPLADKQTVTLKELNGLTFVRTSDPTCLNHWIGNLTASKRLKIKYAITMSGQILNSKMGTIDYPYLTSSLYINWQDKYPIYMKDRALIPVADPDATRNVYLFHMKDRKTSLKQYIDLLLDAFNDQYRWNNSAQEM